MKKLLLLLATALFAVSCTTTKYVDVPSTRTVTETRFLTDTVRSIVYVHDSVFTIQRGDTVIIERYHREKSHEQGTRIIQHDSLVVDTLRVPYPVERKATKWEQTKQDLQGIAIAVLAVCAIVALVYLFIKLRKLARSRLEE